MNELLLKTKQNVL